MMMMMCGIRPLWWPQWWRDVTYGHCDGGGTQPLWWQYMASGYFDRETWHTATMMKMCGIWPARWHGHYDDEAWRSNKTWLKRVNVMTLLVLGQWCRAVRPDEDIAVWRWDGGGRFVPMGTAEEDTRDDAVDLLPWWFCLNLMRFWTCIFNRFLKF